MNSLPNELIVSISFQISNPKDYLNFMLSCKRICNLLNDYSTKEEAKLMMGSYIYMIHPILKIKYKAYCIPNNDIIGIPIFQFSLLGTDLKDEIIQTKDIIEGFSIFRWIELVLFHDFEFKTLLFSYFQYINANEVIWLLYNCISLSIEYSCYSNENINNAKNQVYKILKEWITKNYNREWDYNDNLLSSRLFNNLKTLLYLCNCYDSIIDILKENTFIRLIDSLNYNSINDDKCYKCFLDIPNTNLFQMESLCTVKNLLNIRLEEFINQSWNTHKEVAPNIINQITHFNNSYQRYINYILACNTLEYRALTLLKIVKLQYYCISNSQFPNYDLLFCLEAASHNCTCYRLKHTSSFCEEISPLYLLYSRELFDFSSTNRNYQYLRNHMEKYEINIPYLGIFLRDFTFIDEGNSNFIDYKTDNKIINFRKNQLFTQYVSQFIKNLHNTLNNIQCIHDSSIMKYWDYNKENMIEEDNLLEKSLKLEVRKTRNCLDIVLNDSEMDKYYTTIINNNNFNTYIEFCFPNRTSIDDVNIFISKIKKKSMFIKYLNTILKTIQTSWIEYEINHSIQESIRFRNNIILPIQCRILSIIMNRNIFSSKNCKKFKESIKHEIISYCDSFAYFWD